VTALCDGAVAIDSNVFVHLLNPRNNADKHIDKVLSVLAMDGIELLVDEHGFIATEYQEKVESLIKKVSDTGPEAYLLRYWMRAELRRKVAVERKGSLWKGVCGVIIENNETTDRCFVCIAFACGLPLVTNDEIHILVGPAREVGGSRGSTRRHRLLQVAKREKLRGVVCSSVEAAKTIGPIGK
jgi:hypothetical protein